MAASTSFVDGGCTTHPSSNEGVDRSMSISGGMMPRLCMLVSFAHSCFACRYSLVSGALNISGGSNSTMVSKKFRVTIRTAVPGMVRPARPDLCLQEDWEHQVVTRQDMRRLASYSMERRRHMSMTAQTEGKVRELSAMFEARTMWHTPFGGALNTSSCSSRGISECMGKILSVTACCFEGTFGDPSGSVSQLFCLTKPPPLSPPRVREPSSGARAS
mmetsp:Transcript_25564/g.68195  ORF Transcript_25564/g.68195 Transcript_25564/m.68195 type:complete len:217 (+) Transcript_25564:2207-2857(+)